MPTVKYLRDQRHVATVEAIAKKVYPFPNEQTPNRDVVVNVPIAKMAVGQADGKDLFPDLVILRRPGAWLHEIAVVEMTDTVNDASALQRWKPLSTCGALYIYVPAGLVSEAKKVLKRNKIRVAGIRTWRFRPVWGVDVAEATG